MKQIMKRKMRFFQLHVMDSPFSKPAFPGELGVFQLHVMDSLAYLDDKFYRRIYVDFQLHVMDSAHGHEIIHATRQYSFQLHVMDSP